MLYQLSYEATDWSWGLFIEFISFREEWKDVKYIWNNSYMNCSGRLKWRMIITKYIFTTMIIFILHFHLPNLPPQFKYELFRTYFTSQKLYSFQNLSLSFILRILLKFHNFQSRHSYETYSNNKESASYAIDLSSDYMTSANDVS